MFNKQEIKEFVKKLGKRWLFPDFSNKLTWYVVTLGAGIILMPVPMKLVFYNWLIDIFNFNSGVHFTLPELSSGNADYWVGFFLIAVSLLHNVVSKLSVSLAEGNAVDRLKRSREVDTALFKEFLEVLPSNSKTTYFLEVHDFGNPFSLESLTELEKFVNEWNCPEKHFLDYEIEEKRSELWDVCHKFDWLIAEKSGPTQVGRQSVPPERYWNDWDWPEHVDRDVKEVNKMASEVTKLHKDFIKFTREKLTC